MITRSKDGKLHALAHTCTHLGAVLSRFKKGNRSSFICPFHGWTFSNTGKLLKVKDQTPDAGYLSQNLRFRVPVRPGETVHATITITIKERFPPFRTDHRLHGGRQGGDGRRCARHAHLPAKTCQAITR